MTQSLKKTYVLDTNVLLSDASSLFSFQEHDVIIPMVVLEELDNHKNRQDEVGQNARKVSRELDAMRQPGKSLFAGIELPSGGTLKIVSIDPATCKSLPPELGSDKVDNQLIALLVSLSEKVQRAASVANATSVPEVILVSKDINVRLKCDGLGVRCEDYLKMRITTDTDKFYRGVEVLELSDADLDAFYENGELRLSDDISKNLFPNQILVMKSPGKKSGIGRFLGKGEIVTTVEEIENVFGLKPRNKEQNFSLDLLLNKDIKLLTLTGQAGTGKTLLALAAALQQLKGLGTISTYEKIIVTRPVQPMGRDIGFLPGTLEEKMDPWIAPIRDNLNFLMGHARRRNNETPAPRRRSKETSSNLSMGGEPYLDLLQARGLIEIEALTFIRGRSIPNSIIIIDEAQNLSPHELKTIITRVGDGTKIVLTGDIEQIDNTHVDVYTNGLTHAIEKFKDHKIAAHVTLLKGERSALATLASQIL